MGVSAAASSRLTVPDAASATSAAAKAARFSARCSSVRCPRGSRTGARPASRSFSARWGPRSRSWAGPARVGMGAQDRAQRLAEDGGEAVDLGPARPRQDQDQRRVGAIPCALAEGRGLRLRRDGFGRHRVAHEIAAHPLGLHVGRLEREQREHVVDGFRHLARAFGPPGPDGRRDVVDRRHMLGPRLHLAATRRENSGLSMVMSASGFRSSTASAVWETRASRLRNAAGSRSGP
jgi:hypothetical protein